MPFQVIKYLKKYPKLFRSLKFTYYSFFRLFSRPWAARSIVPKNVVVFDVLPNEKKSFWGYYDRCQVNETGKMLCHSVDHDICRIHVLDRNLKQICIVQTQAWNWQQGALSTWISDRFFIYNDIKNGGVVFRIFDIIAKEIVACQPGTFQSYSPKTNLLSVINNDKLTLFRPDYSFKGREMLHGTDQLLSFLRLEISVGHEIYIQKICTFSAKLDTEKGVVGEKINHVLFNPIGTNAVGLRRYWSNKVKCHSLELFDQDGTTNLLLSGSTISHYCWLDHNNLLVWGVIDGRRGYHAINIHSKDVIFDFFELGPLKDGHPTVFGNGILSDNYPDKTGFAKLWFVPHKAGKVRSLGSFYQPLFFDEARRIDLHPKYSETIDAILLDSGHAGSRKAYICKIT